MFCVFTAFVHRHHAAMLQQQSHAGLESHRQREAAIVRAQWTAAMAQDEDARYRAGTPSTAAGGISLSRPMTASSRPTTATAAATTAAAARSRPTSSSRTGSRGSSRRHKRASCNDASSRECDDSECATEAVPVENFFKRVPALQRHAAAHDITASWTCRSCDTVIDSTIQSSEVPITGCCTYCAATASSNATAVQSTAATTPDQHSNVSSIAATITPAAAGVSSSTELSVSARVYTLVRIVAGRDWRVPGHELIVTDALTDLLTIARYAVEHMVYIKVYHCKHS
jgi:hypothetical protein